MNIAVASRLAVARRVVPSDLGTAARAYQAGVTGEGVAASPAVMSDAGVLQPDRAAGGGNGEQGGAVGSG